MGTTLTGTTPQDTYDSLIKVTDNGPLSGTAKYLSDGLGNDSALAMSTTSVGVGTATPQHKLDVSGALCVRGFSDAASNYLTFRDTFAPSASGGLGLMAIDHSGAGTDGLAVYGHDGISFYTAQSERMRITSAGNVGIGTSAPNTKLDVNGTINVRTNGFEFGRITTNNVTGVDGGLTLQYITGGVFTNGLLLDSAGVVSLTQGQIKFPATQVASADANTLDDYEEGTWTPTISFGGASVGLIYAGSTSGRYTKIGRQVSVTCYILLTNKGTSTGKASIEGLPFAIAGATGFYSAPSFGALSQISYVGMLQGYGEVGTGRVDLVETTEAGVQTVISDADFTNNTQIVMQFTYFV